LEKGKKMAENIAETVENIVNELKRLQGMELQISEALRKHGLTLVKTAAGYDVLKLGEITAESQKKSPERIDQTRRTGAAALAPPGYFKSEQPPTQPQQDPAVGVTYKEVMDVMNTLYAGNIKQVQIAVAMGEKKLYTSPPQRTWVGLAEMEVDDIVSLNYPSYFDIAQAIEAKLKEKNT
jgi:hypothetical protein